MKPKYLTFIETHALDIPELAVGHCQKACEMMIQDFPGELSYCCGYVLGTNFEGKKGKFAHFWLKDKETGEIVDPTASQFAVIEYIEVPAGQC